MWMPFFSGFGTGGGLIVAIGAQNAFILSQGVQRNRPLLIALICAICDSTMILVGTAGMGALIVQSPVLQQAALWGGALFLAAYRPRSFWNARKGGNLQAEDRIVRSLWALVGTTLAVTLLNPHMYLDTVVLVGSIASQFGEQRFLFAAGAICASVLWFFALSYGARLLAPFFQKVWAWRALDGMIGLVMWAIAFSLVGPTLFP